MGITFACAKCGWLSSDTSAAHTCNPGPPSVWGDASDPWTRRPDPVVALQEKLAAALAEVERLTEDARVGAAVLAVLARLAVLVRWGYTLHFFRPPDGPCLVIDEVNGHTVGAGTFADALVALAARVADGSGEAEEVARLTEERDRAIAHDRQPYPTAWAYEQACKALEKQRGELAQVRGQMGRDAIYTRDGRALHDVLSRLGNDETLAVDVIAEETDPGDGYTTPPAYDVRYLVTIATGSVEPEVLAEHVSHDLAKALRLVVGLDPAARVAVEREGSDHG